MTIVVCPICDETFKSLSALKVHFRRRHSNLQECPVCRWTGRSVLLHARSKGDIEHQALCYLLRRPRGGEDYRKKRECAEKMYEMTEEQYAEYLELRKMQAEELNKIEKEYLEMKKEEYRKIKEEIVGNVL